MLIQDYGLWAFVVMQKWTLTVLPEKLNSYTHTHEYKTFS